MIKKILVIDDEEPIRKSFSLALEDTEFEVFTAENGMEGLEKYESEQPDLIFLDLKMPEMNGVEVLQRIREKNTEIPIYIVTAFHKEYFSELKQAQKDGLSFELLQKPVSGEQIAQVTEAILSGVVVINES